MYVYDICFPKIVIFNDMQWNKCSDFASFNCNVISKIFNKIEKMRNYMVLERKLPCTKCINFKCL